MTSPASPLSILSTAQLSIPPSPGALIQIHRMDKEHTSEMTLPHPVIPPSLGKPTILLTGPLLGQPGFSV